jgi:hypothetical protein
LGGLAAGAAARPRRLGLKVRLELEDVQMTPFPSRRVMHRLVPRSAVRAVWLLLTLEDCRTTIADPVDAIVPPTQWAANDHDALLDG